MCGTGPTELAWAKMKRKEHKNQKLTDFSHKTIWQDIVNMCERWKN
jgi:hypothetical protein